MNTNLISRICSRLASASLAALLASAGLTGCAALHPIHGVDVCEVDPCLLEVDRPRTEGRTIDLSLLGQPRPTAHVVDAGDVLGIFIEGVLGNDEQGPPVVSPSLGATPGALTTATVASANLGYPITVRDDGHIALPYRPAIAARGLTLGELESKIRDVYSGPGGLLKPGRDRIFVTLHKPRTVRVLVVRKDRVSEPPFAQPPDYRRADDGRGTAVLVELPAFENDVLHALVASGGLPGSDAENAVYVMRAGGACALDACSPGPGWSMMPGQPLTHQSVPNRLEPSSMMAAARPIRAAQNTGIMQTSARVITSMPVPADWSLATGHSLMAQVAPLANAMPLQHLSDPFANRVAASPYATSPNSASPFDNPRQRVPAVGHSTFQSPVQPADAYAATTNQSAIEPASFGHSGTACDIDPYATACCDTGCYNDSTVDNAAVRKIPLRVLPGETPEFVRSDVLLGNGDIVFIESRSKEYFYTAGLLGGGKYPMPRDEDTDLLDAIALADSQRRVVPTRSVGGVSSLNQDVTIGASRVIIFRPNGVGGVVPIKVNLNKLKQNPAASPLIKPGDRIVLQYTKLEAIAATFERHFLEGSVLGVASGVTFGDN